MKPIFVKFVSGLCLITGLLLAAENKVAAPKLEHAFDLHLQLGKGIDVGVIGPAGSRRVASVTGGTVDGPSLKGKLLPGTDYQIIHPDGLTELDAHYVVQTDTGETLYVINHGIRHAPADVLKKMNSGEIVDPSLVYFRTMISVETAAPALQWMNRSLFVATGERLPTEAIIHVYRVL
jgi:hypothetical protein